MVHYLCTTRKFWIKELASPSFMPSSLRSTLQLNNLSNNLISIFGSEIKSKLAELTISSAINSPYQPITCRALQLYRSLNLPITDRVILKLTQKLSEIISDPHEERQAAVLEIIDTFVVGIEYLRKEPVPKYPSRSDHSSDRHQTVIRMHTRQASGHRRSGSMYGQELNLGAGDSSSFTNQSPSSKDIPYPFPTEEPDHIGPEVQIGTFGNLLRLVFKYFGKLLFLKYIVN